jgi:hypothetical protein
MRDTLNDGVGGYCFESKNLTIDTALFANKLASLLLPDY